MDFPAYVPAAVRLHIKTLTEDDSVQLGDRLAVLRRLGHDCRMREVYQLLTRELSDDSHLRGFVYAAWSAHLNFSAYRERLKRADDLREKIAAAAEQLAVLLRAADDIDLASWPSAFSNVQALLRGTDNHEFSGRSMYEWRRLRGHLLGDNGFTTSQGNAGSENKTPPSNGYMWGLAPPVSELLDTVANVARSFKPIESGMVGAAIPTRQGNEKIEYLRAFAHVLTETHEIELTTPTMEAMAITANVVINDKDIDASVADVRHALTTSSAKRRLPPRKK